MDRKREIRTVIIVLVGLLFLVLIHQYFENFEQLYNPKNYLSIHILLELISISIASAIALQGWMIFTHTLSRHRLYIGALFLCIALIDILHVLSFNGMPFFITENSVLIPTWLWIISRFLLGISLFVILAQKDRAISMKHRPFVFSLSIVLFLGIAGVVYLGGDYLPVLVVEGVGVTPLKIKLEYCISFIFLCLILLLLVQYRKKKDAAHLMLISAMSFALFSEIIFTFYQSVFDFDNFLGHIYKAVSYYFLMKGLYSATLEEPFLKQKKIQKELKQSEQRLNTIVNTVASGIMMADVNEVLIMSIKKLKRFLVYVLKNC